MEYLLLVFLLALLLYQSAFYKKKIEKLKKPEVTIELYEYQTLVSVRVYNKEKALLGTMTRNKEYPYYYSNLNRTKVTEKVVEKQVSSIWHVLGCMPTKDKSQIEAAFKRMAKVYHPDCGGSSKAFQILTEARDKSLSKC